jgi:hypothetical protein
LAGLHDARHNRPQLVYELGGVFGIRRGVGDEHPGLPPPVKPQQDLGVI